MFSLLLNIAYAFLGSFVIIFQMLSQGVYETEGEAGPNNKISCSIKVTNLSAGTSTASSDGAYDCPLTLSINGIKEPLLPKFLREIFPFDGLV